MSASILERCKLLTRWAFEYFDQTATLPVLRWRVTPPGTHEIPRPIPVREGVVSKNTNELKTCISQSVSYRRVYACFAKGSWNAWS